MNRAAWGETLTRDDNEEPVKHWLEKNFPKSTETCHKAQVTLGLCPGPNIRVPDGPPDRKAPL